MQFNRDCDKKPIDLNLLGAEYVSYVVNFAYYQLNDNEFWKLFFAFSISTDSRDHRPPEFKQSVL